MTLGEYMNKKYSEREDKDNIFGVGISDAEFRELIIEYLLEDDWYAISPMGQKQVNEIALYEILEKHSKRYRKEKKEAKKMTKEKVIRNLKYTKEKYKDDRVDTFGTDIALMCEDVLNVLDNCIEIPNNATNGDVIKAIFNIPDSEIDEGLSTTYIYTKTRVLKGGSQDLLREQITFNREWWNAPYKKG